jgi:hypothetical protein
VARGGLGLESTRYHCRAPGRIRLRVVHSGTAKVRIVVLVGPYLGVPAAVGEAAAPWRTLFEITSQLTSDMASLISLLEAIGQDAGLMENSPSAYPDAVILLRSIVRHANSQQISPADTCLHVSPCMKHGDSSRAHETQDVRADALSQGLNKTSKDSPLLCKATQSFSGCQSFAMFWGMMVEIVFGRSLA